MVAVVPDRTVDFEDELEAYHFPPEKSRRLKKVMGFGRHRLVDDITCASDLCLTGLHHLLNHDVIGKHEIDGLILVTQTPDHFIPPSSNILHGKLGLPHETLCLDINQGCAGFIIGLMQAFMLLESGMKKVVLLNADTLSRRCGRRDRHVFPMIGDAGSVCVIENDPDHPPIPLRVRMDGSRSDALKIPAGGFRLPSIAETAKERDCGDANLRSLDQFAMDGTAVFHFVQTEVPPLIETILSDAGTTKADIDCFLFHQANRFMLQKLADKIGVPHEKVPGNLVENFGNSSSATIPVTIAFNFGKDLCQRKYTVCLAGFGVGLTWAATVLTLGNMDICTLIEHPLGKGQSSR